jgi:hypothetical protein
MLEFREIDRVVAAGHRAALAALEQADERIPVG